MRNPHRTLAERGRSDGCVTSSAIITVPSIVRTVPGRCWVVANRAQSVAKKRLARLAAILPLQRRGVEP